MNKNRENVGRVLSSRLYSRGRLLGKKNIIEVDFKFPFLFSFCFQPRIEHCAGFSDFLFLSPIDQHESEL